MKSKKNLVLFGNSVIKKYEKDIYLCNSNIASYLSDLSSFFRVNHVALTKESNALQYLITNNKFKIIACRSDYLSLFIKNIYLIIFIFLKRPYCIFWHSGIFFPVFIFAKLIRLKTLMYVGINPNIFKRNIFTLQRRIIKIMISLSDSVVVRGEGLAKELKYLNNNTKVAQPLISFSLEKINLDEINNNIIKNNSIRILFIGKPIFEKGFNNILSFLDQISQNYKLIELIVVGENSLIDKNALKIIKANKDKSKLKVLLKGYINDPDELINIYSYVDFVICPSLIQEGSPRVIDESIILRKPIICSNVINLDEAFLKNPGIISFDPWSKISLENSIKYIISNHEKINAFYLKNESKIILSAALQHKQLLDNNKIKFFN